MDEDEKLEDKQESEIVKELQEKYNKEIEELKKKLADKDNVIKELIHNPTAQEQKNEEEQEQDKPLDTNGYIKGVVDNIANKLKNKKKGM